VLKKISVAIFVFLALVAVLRPALALVGDVNGDGIVNMEDLYIVALSFGSTPGTPGWKPAADVNGDGIVNMIDLLIVALYFGT
jgi:hypothetical protein